MHISTKRSPKTEKFNIVRLNKTERTEILKLFISERESAEVVNLCIDFFHHFLGEYYILVAALEDVGAVEVSVFVEHNLVHIELIKVSVE
jgi:hypothetical protein